MCSSKAQNISQLNTKVEELIFNEINNIVIILLLHIIS